MQLENLTAELAIPGLGSIGGEWSPDVAERAAAWELYVELITRVGVVKLPENQGLLRDAYSSLHSVFGTTRGILRRHGPAVAHAEPPRNVSFGHLAVVILNEAIRPLLAEWHPRLVDHEARRPEGRTRVEWEREWKDHTEARAALADVSRSLDQFAGILGEVCGVASITATVRQPDILTE